MKSSPTDTRKKLLVFCIVFVVVAASAVFQTPSNWKDDWDLETSTLISNSVYRKVHWGYTAPLAHPIVNFGREQFTSWYSDQIERNYFKQFGLQVYVLASLAPSNTESMEAFLRRTRFLAAIAASAVVALLITLFAERAGRLPAFVLLLFVVSDARFLSYLHSLYWLPGLGLLPLCIVLARYSPGTGRLRLGRLLCLFAVFVFIRALCGYEHISVIVCTSAAATAYLGNRSLSRDWGRDALCFLVAGGTAVLAAIAVHGIQLYLATSSIHFALENTIGNAINRSVGRHEHVQGAGDGIAYLRGAYGAIAHDKPLALLLVIWSAVLIAFFLRSVRTGRYDDGVDGERSLAVASFLGLIATSTWFLLMRGHVSMAPQFNGLAFWYGFVWFAVPFIVRFLGRWASHRQSAIRNLAVKIDGA